MHLVSQHEYCAAEFNTSDYGKDMGADTEEEDPPSCQYRGYRNPPAHEKKYDLSPQYWHVFAARLAFVVVFEVMSRCVPRQSPKMLCTYSLCEFSDLKIK
jgi:hypothetical protein